MARSKQEKPRFAKVEDALNLRNVEDLKQLVALLPTDERPARKGELVKLILRYLAGDHLQALWLQLDETQQNAVRETLYSAEGFFNAERFRARYGSLPNFGEPVDNWRYRINPSLLRLFIYGLDRYNNHYPSTLIPEDLQERLRAFVPPPAAPKLKTVDDLPEFFERIEKEYEFSDDPADVGPTIYMHNRVYEMRRPRNVKEIVHQIPLQRRDTERAAAQDVVTLLRLVDKGKLTVSDKTFQPSAATMDEIATLLRDSDFYEPEPKLAKHAQEIGLLKAFAWPLLLQAGKLAELSGRKLALTKAGRQALNAPTAETLKLLWQRWLKNKLLDELNRVEIIKGQYGKGKRGLTATEGRRAVIAQALKQCPVGQWVEFDQFSRFMRAAAYDFEVSRQPWELYIEDHNYGNLGYDNSGGWNVLQERYMLCLLFEYAATLGLLDVAYVTPRQTRRDYKEMWGADELDFLSRYDGLLYFRLNPLGAYCLDLTPGYTPSQLEARATLTVLPSLQINLSGELSPDEKLLLETYAEPESETVWHLSREKALAAVEAGNQLDELREFLQARDEQELPDTVVAFLVTTERNARVLKQKGVALLIECADAELAELLATHERTKKLCLRAGEKHLVVKEAEEETFRKAVHLLGYGMPRV